MSNDAALRSQYDSVKADLDRYIRVRDGISSHRLNVSRSTSEMDDYIKYIEEIIEKIGGHDGYHYLESASNKLSKHKDVLQEYVDFVRNANISYMDLYNEVVAQISILETRLTNIRNEYNKDKKFFERLGGWF